MTRQMKIGNRVIGGGLPVLIQSMTNTKTKDVDATVAQIHALEAAGCDIIRVAVPDLPSAIAIKDIKSQINIPIVADIHFDYKLALAAIDSGVDKLRLNPGNITDESKVGYVIEKLKERDIPLRIGVNNGSISSVVLEKYGNTATALVESALEHVAIAEKYNYDNICISVKSSSVIKTVHAYRELSKRCDYPLHLGVTEAGVYSRGVVKSAAGIGSLLIDGIGDTIRVSLTGDPTREVICAIDILASLDMYDKRPDIISCPTCARCNIDVDAIAEEIIRATSGIKKNIKIAVMGCIVNGPGEARDCDLGVAGGNGKSALFEKGKLLKTVYNIDIIPELLRLIDANFKNI